MTSQTGSQWVTGTELVTSWSLRRSRSISTRALGRTASMDSVYGTAGARAIAGGWFCDPVHKAPSGRVEYGDHGCVVRGALVAPRFHVHAGMGALPRERLARQQQVDAQAAV